MTNNKWLVTGGAGFIGSHLVQELVRRGHQVRVADDFSSGLRENIPAGVELVEGDLADAEVARKAVAGCGIVLHQAARPSVPRSVQDPAGSNRANVTATVELLVAARDAGVKRLVFAGSSSVYGDAAALPKREDMPAEPLSPYALQKLVSEQVLPDVHASLRVRDGVDALLQRVRPAATAGVAVLGRDLAVHRGTGPGASAARAGRWSADARLHLRRRRRRGRPRLSGGARRRGRGDQRRGWGTASASSTSCGRCKAFSTARSSRRSVPRARATCAILRPTSPKRSVCSGLRPRCRWKRGCAGQWRGTRPRPSRTQKWSGELFRGSEIHPTTFSSALTYAGACSSRWARP